MNKCFPTVYKHCHLICLQIVISSDIYDPVSITFYDGYLYWVEYSFLSAIYKIQKTGTGKKETVVSYVDSAMDIKAFFKTRQKKGKDLLFLFLFYKPYVLSSSYILSHTYFTCRGAAISKMDQKIFFLKRLFKFFLFLIPLNDEALIFFLINRYSSWAKYSFSSLFLDQFSVGDPMKSQLSLRQAMRTSVNLFLKNWYQLFICGNQYVNYDKNSHFHDFQAKWSQE